MKVGQRIQFIYTKTEDGIHAWDLPDEFNPALNHLPRYKELLFRAVHEVLQPIGIAENVLRDWIFNERSDWVLDSNQRHTDELPLFVNLKYLSVGQWGEEGITEL